MGKVLIICISFWTLFVVLLAGLFGHHMPEPLEVCVITASISGILVPIGEFIKEYMDFEE